MDCKFLCVSHHFLRAATQIVTWQGERPCERTGGNDRVDLPLNQLSFWRCEPFSRHPRSHILRRALKHRRFILQLSRSWQVSPNVNASTVPANGDQNPYGVAFVPQGIAPGGKLHAGDILVSNFNNSTAGGNLQGTGTTIVEIAPDGSQSLFFQGPKGLGLTTALGVLRNGFVLVGNVPTSDGSFSTIQKGSLLILDKQGEVVANLQDPVKLDGPWDLTVADYGNLAFVYVSNVLNGTVTRLVLSVPTFGNDIRVLSSTTIASGYAHRSDPNALVVGPTGLAFDPVTDVLYVASTDDNAIYSIPFANIRLTRRWQRKSRRPRSASAWSAGTRAIAGRQSDRSQW